MAANVAYGLAQPSSLMKLAHFVQIIVGLKCCIFTLQHANHCMGSCKLHQGDAGCQQPIVLVSVE